MNLKNFLHKMNESLILRKMRYFSDQDGIIRRYLHEKEYWESHIKKSKEFILKSAENKKKGKVVVLGSGWLLDLPIEELSNQFGEVILVDIRHPKQILHKIKKYTNVKTIKTDITGGLIQYIFKELKQSKKKKVKLLLGSAHSFSYKIPENTDFVISLNVMCQLHIILIDYIKNNYNLANSELINLTTQIQQSHLNMLPKDKTCLITDIEEEILTKEVKTTGVKPLMQIELPKGKFESIWQWKFDTSMTYRDDFKTFFNTKAIDF